MHIASGDEPVVMNCSRSDERLPGVSGYVVYSLHGQHVAIAFSNPTFGYNKLNVGVSCPEKAGKNVWDNMEHHSEPTAKTLVIGGKAFNVQMTSTSGSTNDATVTFYLANQ